MMRTLDAYRLPLAKRGMLLIQHDFLIVEQRFKVNCHGNSIPSRLLRATATHEQEDTRPHQVNVKPLGLEKSGK